MKVKANIFFTLFASSTLCVVYDLARAEDHVQLNPPEVDRAVVKQKYSRIVMFGDSQLDVGNITKNIFANRLPVTLPLGAPFTPGAGNFAQQLLNEPIINANPIYWSETFSPFGYDVKVEVESEGGKQFIRNDAHVNMAQGGGKLSSTFPGASKDIQKTIARQAVSGFIEKLPTSSRWIFRSMADGAINFVLSRMSERNITLINKISEQPLRFSEGGGVFSNDDLAIIMAGGNDIIEQGYTGARQTTIARREVAESRQKLLVDVIHIGAKNILFGNIPDIRLTPTLLNWRQGEQNGLHLGIARDAKSAWTNISHLTDDINASTTPMVLNTLLRHPGVTVTLFDTFKMLGHIAGQGELYGIDGSLKLSCDAVAECKHARDAKEDRYLTQDGLHPSVNTSRVFANAYTDYLRTPSKSIRNRVEGQGGGYNAYFDAFVDLTAVQEKKDTVRHYIIGGLLDLSLQQAADALSREVRIDGGVLYFDGAAENLNSNIYTQAFSSDLLIGAEEGKSGAAIDVANINSTLTYSGNASGGPLLKSGPGRLVLSGNNTVMSMVKEGILQIGDGTDRGWIDQPVHNESIVEFNRSDNRVFGSEIHGSGTLVKAGSGSLSLTGLVSMEGRAEVNRGGLGLNSVMSAVDVHVNDGAFVYGSGSVRSITLEHGAAVAPGNSIGTLNVMGDVTFNKGAMYKVEVNPASLSDSINAGGTAYIRGGELQVNAEAGDYGFQTQYLVLSAQHGVIGSFDNVTSNFSFLEPSLKYGASDVALLLLRNDVRPADLCEGENGKSACAQLLPSAVAPEVIAQTPTPIVETPSVAQTPAPVIEAPSVAQTPAPAVEAPSVAQTPAPAIEAPSVAQTPAPVTEAPSVAQTPAPAVEAPSVAQTPAPVTEAPSVAQTPAPVIEAPSVAQTPAPVIEAPSVAQTPAPVVEAPSVVQPEALAVTAPPQPEESLMSTAAAPNPLSEGFLGDGESGLLTLENRVVLGMSRSEFMAFSTSLPGEIHPTIATVLDYGSSHTQASVTHRLYETRKGLVGAGAWGHMFGSEGSEQSTRGLASLSRNSQGFVLGSDVEVEDISVGVFGGYQKTSISQALASADVETYSLGIYGAKRFDAWTASQGANVAWHDVSTKRRIYYKDQVSTPEASYHGTTLQLFTELAYGLDLGRASVEPYIGLSYTRHDLSGSSEEKKLFSLKGYRDVQEVYAGRLGARVNYPVQLSEKVTVNFQTGAAWKHALSDVSTQTDMQFQSHGEEFAIAGRPLQRNILRVNGNISVQTKHGLSMGLDYMTERAPGMRDQSISLSGVWAF
ncbi:autotransporter domain-containing protein [Pseudomonas sp. 2835]|uniref:autotransporter domain-containing protein n=1 Tax=Pseudomonas sp. 2835 TaxID=3156451 RepID=UPI003D246BD3